MGEIPGAPGSSTEGRDSVDDSDSVDDGGSGSGSDDRVLSPDSPDEPTSTSSGSRDRDRRSRNRRRSSSGSSPDSDRNSNSNTGSRNTSSRGSGSGGGNDDRVLTPDSPDDPTSTTGSGSDRGQSSSDQRASTPNPSSNPVGGDGGSRPSSDPLSGDTRSSVTRTRDDGLGLEDAAGSDRSRVTAEAERLEQRVLSQNPRYDEDDVRVVRRGDELVVETTPAYERQRATARRDSFDNIPGTGAGETEFAQDRDVESSRAKARRESVDNIPGTGAGETEFAQNRDVESDRAKAREESVMKIPELKEDVNTQRRQRRRAAKEQLAQAASEKTGVDYSASDVQVTRNEDGSLSFSVEQKEAFDDDWSFGLGDPEKDEVEAAVDGAADAYQTKVTGAASYLFKEETSGESLGSAVLRTVGRDDAAEAYDAKTRAVGRKLFIGIGSIGNVPGLVGGGMEIAENVAAGVGEATTPGDQEFGSKALNRGTAMGEAFAEEATENPLETGALAFGSLAGSYGAISTASKISSRAGTATRYAIQPGEELAGTIGHSATKATAGTKAADKLFPNKEPLIFSEEAAIRGGKKAVSKVRGLEYQDAATRMQPSRLAQEAQSARFKAAELMRSDAPTRTNDVNTRVLDAAKRETRSARFKAEELLRSDGPTRVNTDVDVPGLDTVRREATSARFKAAEARTKAERGVERVRSGLRKFSGDDRAQAQAPRSRLREQTRGSDSRGPSLDPDGGSRPELDTRPRTEMTRRRETTLSGPSLDSTPFTSDLRGLAPELGTGDTQARQQQSALTSPLESVRPRGETDLGRSDIFGRTETRPSERTTSEFDLRGRTELGFEMGRELEFETELELESETRNELENDGLTGGSSRRRRSPFGGDPFSKTVERDLINPFTGE
jgi:hypothetical protein